MAIEKTAPRDRVRVQTLITDPGKTKQSFKKESDINNIMAKYQKSGAIDHFAKNSGQYGFATSQDFHQAMNLVIEAQELFDALPSSLRRRFQNDPGEFLEFVQDPKNADEMVELGLAEPPVGTRPVEPPDGPVVASQKPVEPGPKPELEPGAPA